jgi:putative transposase
MKKSRFTVEQIIGVLRETQAGAPVKEVCAKHNIGEQTYYGWKRKYGDTEMDEARRLKRLVANYAVQIQILKEVNAKNGEPVQSAAGRALGVARSTFYRGSNLSLENRRMRQEIMALSEQHPRYGYRRVTALLRRGGSASNAKRVQRVRREQGMQVSKKQRRMRRSGNEPPATTRCGVGTLSRTRRKTGAGSAS